MERIYQSKHDTPIKTNTSVKKNLLPINSQTQIKNLFYPSPVAMSRSRQSTPSNNTQVSIQAQVKSPNVIQMWREAPPSEHILVRSNHEAEALRVRLMREDATEFYIGDGGPGAIPRNSFHRDYLMDCRTGLAFGHGPANPHRLWPHINMLDEGGRDCAISITSNSFKVFHFSSHALMLLRACGEATSGGDYRTNVRKVFTPPMATQPCPRANLVNNITDVEVQNEILGYYDEYCT